MNASKQECRNALDHLKALADSLDPKERTKRSHHFIILEEFLRAAERKLPNEKSFARDNEKRAK
jgi:hypothetical protein